MFLALDTVFGQCSVALVSATGEVLVNETKLGNREQTQQILPMVDAALTSAQVSLAQLTALVFNRGPGAFSGIRINTAVVQALSVAHDLPCVGISSLQILAQAAFEQYKIEHCYAVHDARMQQVYLGEFNVRPQELNNAAATLPKIMQDVGCAVMTEASSQSSEQLVDYDQVTPLKLPLVGDGASLLTAQPEQRLIESLSLDAAILARLGIAQFQQQGGVAAEQALPVYLRNHAWKTLKEQGKA